MYLVEEGTFWVRIDSGHVYKITHRLPQETGAITIQAICPYQLRLWKGTEPKFRELFKPNSKEVGQW